MSLSLGLLAAMSMVSATVAGRQAQQIEALNQAVLGFGYDSWQEAWADLKLSTLPLPEIQAALQLEARRQHGTAYTPGPLRSAPSPDRFPPQVMSAVRLWASEIDRLEQAIPRLIEEGRHQAADDAEARYAEINEKLLTANDDLNEMHRYVEAFDGHEEHPIHGMWNRYMSWSAGDWGKEYHHSHACGWGYTGRDLDVSDRGWYYEQQRAAIAAIAHRYEDPSIPMRPPTTIKWSVRGNQDGPFHPQEHTEKHFRGQVADLANHEVDELLNAGFSRRFMHRQLLRSRVSAPDFGVGPKAKALQDLAELRSRRLPPELQAELNRVAAVTGLG